MARNKPPNLARFRLAERGHPVVGWYVENAGLQFHPAELTPEEREIVDAAIGRKRFRMKECFHNAQRIVTADRSGSLAYVEGYRIGECGPIHHAWVALNRKVIDVTLGENGADYAEAMRLGLAPFATRRVYGTFEDAFYVGVPIDPSWFAARRGADLLDDWGRDFPLIRAFEKSSGKLCPTLAPLGG